MSENVNEECSKMTPMEKEEDENVNATTSENDSKAQLDSEIQCKKESNVLTTQSSLEDDTDRKETTTVIRKDNNQTVSSVISPKQIAEVPVDSDQNEGAKKNDAIVAKTISSAADTSTSADDKYAEYVTYTDDGSAIYTDPVTNCKYKWSTEQNNWVPCDTSSTTSAACAAAANPYENEHYKWCSQTEQWIAKSQATETEHYKWDAEKSEWIAKVQTTAAKEDAVPDATASADVTYGIDEDGQRIRTDKDGAVYFWDAEKNAWFPKIDDDFMARYQMSYGFIDNTSVGVEEQRLKEEKEEQRKEEELKRMAEEAKASADAALPGAEGIKRKAAPEPPKWFDMDPEHNTKVYVSNLPLDITIDEFAELMGKCGMIMRDPQTQKLKLKLYTEADGQIKGDGLCDYIKIESVDLALNILDDYDLRGNKIHVQHAKFQMRGEYNPALKPKRKKKDKEKLQKIKEKLFDWRPEKMRGERTKNEKVVILKNLFQPEIFEKEVQLILEYQNDLREECSKCGTVRKVVIFDRHAEGVAQVNMASPEEADLVIQMMQGRFFGKRQLSAEHWDGQTKYKIVESENEVQQRLSKWDQFLETDEDKKDTTETIPTEIEEAEIEKTIETEN